MYYQIPSLKRPENDILVLLTNTSVDSTVSRVTAEWVLTRDGRVMFEKMLHDLQNSQPGEQLGLTLAALLCYRRLLPTSQGTTKLNYGSYLTDFFALLHCDSPNNEQAMLERMILSFLRVLETFKDEFQYLRQFLATILDMDTPLHHCDAFLDQYWAHRIKPRQAYGLDHIAARKMKLDPGKLGAYSEDD
jgi:hypothetical protein